MQLHRAPLLLFASVVLAALSACEPAPCCRDDESCGEGLVCFDGRCTYECASDDDCALFELCARPTDGRALGVCYAPGEDEGECRERKARPAHDAGPFDAGRPDAGPADAGPRDAGPNDAGPNDAGPNDAGPDEDAGPPDAGPDEDSGPPDAGPDEDAGPIACVDDEYEDNDTEATATPLLPSVGSLTAIACPDDPDLYEVRVTAGEALRVALGYDAPPGMRLSVSAPGQGVLGTSSTGSGLEEVRVVPASSGSVFVRVAAVSTGEARPYGLLFDREAPGACVDDEYEPNDSQQQATPLALPANVSARICAPDPDFFEVDPAGATQLTIRFSESPGVGLLLTVLRRSDFAILGVITAGAGVNVVEVGEDSGPVLLIVAGGGDADYELGVE